LKDRVFKVAMLHLKSTEKKDAATSEEIKSIQTLIDIVRGKLSNNDYPTIKNTEDFYEAAKTLGIDKHELPKIIMGILSNADTMKLPTGLIENIGEYLGEKKGIKLIPTSLLQRTFIREELDKKVGPNKWEFFFKDKDKLKQLKEQKGF